MAPDTPVEERRRRLSGKCEQQKKESGLPTPPDGGWGWVVVFGSFMIHVIADGVAYSFGIFYIEFLDYFNAGRGPTGWIGSLMVGITWGSGPIASALTNKYGCRAVTIAGALVSSVGFILSIFAPNIWFMYFSFGIVGGFGLGLIYLPAIVSVTYYFEKRRSFATGLAVCGSGLGTFIFAPLTKILVENYTWKGAVLIEAGLLLNCVACGALFRPLEAPVSEEPETPVSNGNIYTGKRHPLSNGSLSSGFGQTDTDEEPESPTSNGVPINAPLLKLKSDNLGSSAHSLQITNPRLPAAKQEEFRLHGSDTALHKKQGVKRLLSVPGVKSDDANLRVRVLARKDIFYTSSLQNIPMYRSNPNMYNQSIMSLPDELAHEKDENTCASSKYLPTWLQCSPEMKESFRQMMDFSLLSNPLFLMFAISNFFTSIGFCVPYIFLPDRAKILGIGDNQAAFLIAVIGIANTIGRVFFGFLSDRSFINRLWLYNSALTLCGICTALSAMCVTYEWLLAYAASFGMFIGVYVSLTSVVLVDLLGLEALTSSFGLTLLFIGIAGVIGTPIAGWITDAVGSYDVAFYIMGAVIALSGLMLFFIPCVRTHVEKKEDITQHDVDMGRKVTDETILSVPDISKSVSHHSNFV